MAYLDWAAILLETVRIQMGDAAFGPFLRCVVEAEDACVVRTKERAAASALSSAPSAATIRSAPWAT